MQIKRLTALTAAALALTVAACGSSDDGDAGTSTSASSGSSTSSGCGYAAVFPGPTGANQSLRAFDAGFEDAGKKAGEDVRVVESSDEQSFIANLKSLAARECHAAIGTVFFSSSNALQQVATQFPDQRFFIVDGFVDLPNVTNFSAKPEELTYIAGAMAAQLSQRRAIGIVLGNDQPTLQRFRNGYAQGARLIDPAVAVRASYVGSFTDPAKSATLAIAQASQGVDLIYGASGSNLEIYAQGARNGYRTIASDPIEYEQARAKDADIAFVAIIDQQALGESALSSVIDGRARGGALELGLAEGVFDVPGVISGSSPYPLPEPVIAAGRRAYEGLKSGELEVSDPTAS